jgi:hypothetical protein
VQAPHALRKSRALRRNPDKPIHLKQEARELPREPLNSLITSNLSPIPNPPIKEASAADAESGAASVSGYAPVSVSVWVSLAGPTVSDSPAALVSALG